MDSRRHLLLPVFLIFILNCLMMITGKDRKPSIVSGILEPLEINVLTGGTAEFTCNVTGRDRNAGGQLQWLIDLVDDTSTQGIGVIAVNSSMTFTMSDISIGGNYYLSYDLENENEIITLHITNVTADDGRFFRFTCAHGNTVLSVWAKLNIWTEPTAPLQCSFEGSIPTIIDVGDVYPISLRCHLNDGEPSPVLTWHTVEQGRYRMIGDIVTNKDNTVTRQVTSLDHGRQYTCEATIGAIPDKPLTCSVIPYSPTPIISLIPSYLVIGYEDEETISIICNNTGVSTPTTTYAWYIDNLLQDGDDETGIVTITHTPTSSTIRIANSSFLLHGSRITCEGSIPSVSRSNVSLTVTFLEPNSDSGSSSPGLSVPAIAGAAVGGTCLIIGIVTIMCYMCRRDSNLDRDARKSAQTTSQTVSNDNTRIQNTTDEVSPHQLSRETPTYPAYAVPDKGLESKTTTPSRTQSQLQQRSAVSYEVVNPSNNEDTDPDIAGEQVISNHGEDGGRDNSGGITYADLELTQSAYTNTIINNDQDGNTLYADVKV